MAGSYFVADTTVISRLTKSSEHSKAYNDLLGDNHLAVSFQTVAELKAAPFGARRQQRVDDLLAVSLKLPNTEATGVWYARAIKVRKDLKKQRRLGQDAGEGDMWIVANALEWRFPLLSHDEGQVGLGRAMGARVLTDLQGLRDDNPSIDSKPFRFSL